MLIFEILKFIIYSALIVYISKNILVKLLRKIAEVLDLSPKAVGNIAGFATSMPELLTVFFSSIQGLFDTSIYNIASSNIINLIQYISSIVVNKNRKELSNKAIKIDLGMVIATILIPILMIIFKIDASISIVPIFILLFIFCYYIRSNGYKLYGKSFNNEKEIKKIEDEKKWVRNKKRIAVSNFIKLFVIGIVLYIIGSLLGNTLETLKLKFNIPEAIIGIILGFITSIPELITFIESQKHHSKYTSNIEGVVEATENLFSSNVINLFIIESIGIIIYVFVRR